MVKIQTISFQRSSIYYLLNPEETKGLNSKSVDKYEEMRKTAPVHEGWLFPEDFSNIKTYVPPHKQIDDFENKIKKITKDTSIKKERLKTYAKSELWRERRDLEKLGIAEIKEEKGKDYNKKREKHTPKHEAIRLKKDKQTLLTLWKSSHINRYGSKNPVDDSFTFFMESHYFKTHPQTNKILNDYLRLWFNSKELSQLNEEERKDVSIKLIKILTPLFFKYLEDKQETSERINQLGKIFTKNSDFFMFFTLVDYMLNSSLDKQDLQNIKEIYCILKQDIVQEHYRNLELNNINQLVTKLNKKLTKLKEENLDSEIHKFIVNTEAKLNDLNEINSLRELNNKLPNELKEKNEKLKKLKKEMEEKESANLY